MAQFKAYSTAVEVNGETVITILKGMGAFQSTAKRILADNGIEDPQPGQWYNQQNWLNAFAEINKRMGKSALTLIGQKIPENAQFPPQINSVESGLASIDMAYKMNHRGGPIGEYKFVKNSADNYTIVCNNPYPCDFDKGLIEAVAQKFASTNQKIQVKHDDNKECRNAGGESCTYHVNVV